MLLFSLLCGLMLLLDASLQLCISLPIQSVVDGEPVLYSNEPATEAAAALTAILDVNNRNCSLLEKGCGESLNLEGTEYVQLTPTLVDWRSTSIFSAAPSVFSCLRSGSTVALGFWNSEFCAPAAFFASTHGVLVFGNRAKTPFLSVEERFPLFARTSFSQLLQMTWLAEFMNYLGWGQVSVVLQRGEIGEASSQAFLQQARNKGILVNLETIDDSGGIDFGAVDWVLAFPALSAAVESVKESRTRIILLDLSAEFVVGFLKAASSTGLNVQAYVWIVAKTPIKDILSLADRERASLPEGLLTGLISVEKPFAEEAAQRLNEVGSHPHSVNAADHYSYLSSGQF